MSSLLFSSSVAFSRAGGSFCKASSSSSSSSSPSSSTTKSVRFDFRSPRRRRTTNETTTTTYATTSQNDDGNTKNNSDENMSARELKRKLEELVRCFWVIRILSGVCFSLKEKERKRKIENERTSMIKRCIQKHHLSDLNLRWCETNTNEWDVCSFFSFLFFSFLSLSLSFFLYSRAGKARFLS